MELLASALRRWLDPSKVYAVRSSPDGDDDELHSFAGLFPTSLDVSTTDVMDAIRFVATPDRGRMAAHASRSGGAVPDQLGVVVQVMVPAASAGIAFSRNPLTGLDEVVVETVPTRGDALADEGLSPDRWVHRWGTFSTAPAEPRVPRQVIEAVAKETARLAAAQGRPIDLEWVHDGTTTWWLQARPMTGLDGLRLYSNRIARDVLPGVIKPLVWSVNVPIVNSAWVELLEELVGPLDIRPEDLARSFGHHAYFDMTTLGSIFEALGMPRDSLELLLGLPRGPETPRFRPDGSVVRHLPRVLGFTRRTLRRGRWTRAEVRELQRQYEALAAVDPAPLDVAALLARVDALTALSRRAAYANIVVPLVMLGYDRALGRLLGAAQVDPADVDPADGRSDRASWDPNVALDRLRAMTVALSGEAHEALALRRWAALDEHADLAPLRLELDAFLSRFGHLSESGNDLSVPAWRDDPDAVVGLVLAHPARSGAAQRLALSAVESRLPQIRRPLVRLLWRRSGAFRVYRDAVGATWTRSYGLFRDTFLALGRRLTDAGVLDRPDDVFFLALDEVRALSDARGLPDGDPRLIIARRRAEVADAVDLVVPELVHGDAFVARRRSDHVRTTLEGIPTSRGTVRGPARVVRGAADFARVGAGDVIVIPFSDVAWTPLFARAAGVVAETGGVLSHSSVVAREYGIPCVVSVSGACASIPDGATIVVDGIGGTVVVVDRGPG